jgi:excisionase family DNA binding protein
MTVFTPKMVAERWHVSERYVRNLINRGELRCFRLGGTLLRIAGDAVEDYERCHTQSDATGEGSASRTGKTESGTGTHSDALQRLRLRGLRPQLGQS